MNSWLMRTNIVFIKCNFNISRRYTIQFVSRDVMIVGNVEFSKSSEIYIQAFLTCSTVINRYFRKFFGIGETIEVFLCGIIIALFQRNSLNNLYKFLLEEISLIESVSFTSFFFFVNSLVSIPQCKYMFAITKCIFGSNRSVPLLAHHYEIPIIHWKKNRRGNFLNRIKK